MCIRDRSRAFTKGDFNKKETYYVINEPAGKATVYRIKSVSYTHLLDFLIMHHFC